ncbi:glucose-6-phosphate dehydrogenase [Fictibacillus sp. Mic-4]|uniref:glucose-6-phosphate dehydrogenase n=1 Tax=Fictibacillus TaxID=1329200 RepID=UPI000425C65F|nr:glucose-6-phosphate dehydrogenase [Fictibacillus gelatini]
MNHEIPRACMILFGATGDLSHRKLYPALFQLYQKGKLNDNFGVIGVGRRKMDHDEFRSRVKDAIFSFVNKIDEKKFESFVSHFYFLSMDVTSAKSYEELKQLADELDENYHLNGNRMYYLAMAPEFFQTIPTMLKSSGITDTNGWHRLVIEKPFGHDLESAKSLNEEIQKSFPEDSIFRIDHYLGKEMIQNIQVIRFGNAIFESIWNNKYISSVQITSSETLGVEERAAYYEKSGALLDMVQNHMLQMVMMVAMEPPGELNTKHIRDEKVKVLRSLRFYKGDEVKTHFIRGQYTEGTVNGKQVPGYLEEDNVDPSSTTETFVAAKLYIDNFRWAGVPFYIRTGKRMKCKSTEIVIQFKNGPMALYHENVGNYQPNLLKIHIQPDEGLSLTLNAKGGNEVPTLLPIAMKYSNTSENEINSPEAYEKLLNDCLLGNSTYFTRWDEVALAWEFIDGISSAWKNEKGSAVYPYPAGSMGPKEADELLQKDGHKWWEPTTV